MSCTYTFVKCVSTNGMRTTFGGDVVPASISHIL